MGLEHRFQQLEAFVFAHGPGAGNCPNHTTSDPGFRLQPGVSENNSCQEPHRGVFSLWVDPNHLEKSRPAIDSVSDQRQA